MLDYLRRLIPERHPLRLLYHKVLAFFAAVVYGFPASKMVVIGVTGTNGKTTTVNFITNILAAASYKVAMTSSINFQIGDEKWGNPTKQTTMSPFMLQKFLRRALNEKCQYAVLEVTSHAIDQSRIFGINFDMAVITNIEPEHIEYHGNFNAYLNSKAKLFKKVSNGGRKPGVPKMLILNADSQYYNYFNQFVADRKITYGVKSGTIYASNVEKKSAGSTFSMHVPNNVVEMSVKLPGEFNIYNALCAAACALSLGIDLEIIRKAISESQSVPGRFEQVDFGQDFNVIVDYAHTPEALNSLFELYRKLTSGNLFVVFGATGGGRDKSKRPSMGQMANEFADYIILTNDDPYMEDEWQIVDQIASGVPRKEGHNFWKIPDRREAIRLALMMAKEQDTVVVAGKGCEEIIITKEGKIPWNDKKVIGELIKREFKLQL
ncbi:UDP-N-acetylmuramoyl-L-alanyl-D-glutamate--2,6-diaminopimelate ligase [Candidatus Peregrinibacteria bacterium]|nr:UDP-N-acetylmuramoyl-L-alanyl-D-glutamate--2,6-diaminopimelate ligase [Candidatus Peregrinibacteria bacterium]